ncbi:MAG: hypothetical protein ACRDNE_00380 [Gaiellaceae bacterium]
MADPVDKTHRMRALDELRDEFVRVAHAESRSPRPRPRRLAVSLASLMLVTAGATAAGIILTSDADQATVSQGPSAAFEASGPRYASLAELVIKSDLVVLGTVQEVLPAKVIEAEDPQYPTRTFNTVVRVDEALKGSAPRGVVTVETLELAFREPGPEEWREPGERVLLFLTPSREPDTPELFILANTNYSQTAYVIQGEDIMAAVGDELSEEVATLSLAELRQAVEAAQ